MRSSCGHGTMEKGWIERNMVGPSSGSRVDINRTLMRPLLSFCEHKRWKGEFDKWRQLVGRSICPVREVNLVKDEKLVEVWEGVRVKSDTALPPHSTSPQGPFSFCAIFSLHRWCLRRCFWSSWPAHCRKRKGERKAFFVQGSVKTGKGKVWRWGGRRQRGCLADFLALGKWRLYVIQRHVRVMFYTYSFKKANLNAIGHDQSVLESESIGLSLFFLSLKSVS